MRHSRCLAPWARPALYWVENEGGASRAYIRAPLIAVVVSGKTGGETPSAEAYKRDGQLEVCARHDRAEACFFKRSKRRRSHLSNRRRITIVAGRVPLRMGSWYEFIEQ